jgi:hypothetical protein
MVSTRKDAQSAAEPTTLCRRLVEPHNAQLCVLREEAWYNLHPATNDILERRDGGPKYYGVDSKAMGPEYSA